MERRHYRLSTFHYIYGKATSVKRHGEKGLNVVFSSCFVAFGKATSVFWGQFALSLLRHYFHIRRSLPLNFFKG